MQGRPHTTELLEGIVQDWLGLAAAISVSLGVIDVYTTWLENARGKS